jgi:hypothetical protein
VDPQIYAVDCREVAIQPAQAVCGYDYIASGLSVRLVNLILGIRISVLMNI